MCRINRHRKGRFMRHFFCMCVFLRGAVLKDVYGFRLFFGGLGRGYVLWHKNGEISWRRMSLWDSGLVKMCKFFLKKSCEKIWFVGENGSTFATANGERRFPPRKKPHVQPQTGNGGSLRGKSPTGIWRNGRKSLPLQNRPSGVRERTLK